MKENRETKEKKTKKKVYSKPDIKKSTEPNKVNILQTCTLLSAPPQPCGTGAVT